MLLAVSVALAGEPCVWRAEPLPISTPASWGSITPALAVTPEDGSLRVWYPTGRGEPMMSARITDAGGLDAPAEFAPFEGLGEEGYPVISADGQAAVASVYVAEKDADIFLTTREAAGWTAPLAIRPDGGLDNDPVVAHEGGRTAVAWSAGTYPFAPDLALAIVEDGAVLSSGVIIEGAHAEGMALLAVPSGWLLIYTPTSAGPRDRQGLVTVRLSHDGEVLQQQRISTDRMIWPVAARGHGGVGVAVRSGREVGFLKLSEAGELLGEVGRADFHPDPIAAFRPMSLAADEDGWWLADVASFSASVIVAGPSEGRIARLDAAGARQSVTTIGLPQTGTSSVRILPTDQGLRGMFTTDREGTLSGVTMVCGEPPEPEPPDGCAPERIAGTSDARNRITESVAVGDDLVVLTRADDGRTLQRVSPTGRSKWGTPLPGTWEPRVGLSGDEVAVISDEEGLTLRRYAARSGRILGKHTLPDRRGAACIAGHEDGWLVVRARERTREIMVLDRAGAVLSSENQSGAFGSCDLLETPEGYLLTLTHPGRYSETNHLFTVRIGADGVPQTGEQRVASVGFARRPQLSRGEAGTLLTFTGPLGRDVSAVALDGAGLACGEDQEIAGTYGLTGFSAWPDRILWSTDEGLFGRGCLEVLACPE